MRKGRFLGQDLMKGENPNFPQSNGARTNGPQSSVGQRGGQTSTRGVEPAPEATPLGVFFSRKDIDVATTPKSTSPAPEIDNQNVSENTGQTKGGTSIFDPVLCELAYRWFCPKGGRVLDPFAGGSVRGIVAARLGLAYLGFDIRAEQIAANEAQAKTILRLGDPAPHWHLGDCRDMLPLVQADIADMVFACPPYGDLERYSDDPRDLSTLSLSEFDAAMAAVIAGCVRALTRDRFSIWVVSDYRDQDGAYVGFPSKIRRWHQEAGAAIYNEAILINSAGSLPIRAGKQFAATRKLGRMHQELLIFLKGDARRATEAMAPIDAKAIDEALTAAGAQE